MTAVSKTARPKLSIAVPNVGPVVIPCLPQVVPLWRLARAPENVRRIRIDEDIPELADDMTAHGQLQSLIGYLDSPAPDATIFICGGGRRLQAFEMMVVREVIDRDFPVAVLIREREEAIELSLAENIQQRTMSPVDEVFGFKALIDTGHHTVTSLAKRFGFRERVVKQRLRLADLAPEILDALAERAITMDAAMAYAATQDRTLQSQIFTSESKRPQDNHSSRNIRATIEAKGIRTTHPLFRFVGADIYEARGGGYEEDLFRDDPDGAQVLANPALLHTIAVELVEERMAERLPELQADPALSPTLIGHITVPGLRLASWGYAGPITPPTGCEIVTLEDPAPMWRTIRNNGLPARVLAGINDAGELIVWPKTVAVDKGQRDAVAAPIVPSRGYVPPTPEQQAEMQKVRGIVRWSRRLAVNALGGSPLFAGTPLEGRAYWPAGDGEPSVKGGVQGVLVPVDVFVSDDEIAQQRKPATARFAQEVAAIAAAESNGGRL